MTSYLPATAVDIILAARSSVPKSIDSRFPKPVHVFGYFAVCSVYAVIYNFNTGDILFELGDFKQGQKWIPDAISAVSNRDLVDVEIITALSKIYEAYDGVSIPSFHPNLRILPYYKIEVGNDETGFVTVFDNKTILNGEWRKDIIALLEKAVRERDSYKLLMKSQQDEKLARVAAISLK